VHFYLHSRDWPRLHLYFRLKRSHLPLSVTLSFYTFIPFKANFKESYMAAFYDYFNEQKYADAVKNVSVSLPSLLHAINLQLVDT